MILETKTKWRIFESVYVVGAWLTMAYCDHEMKHVAGWSVEDTYMATVLWPLFWFVKTSVNAF